MEISDKDRLHFLEAYIFTKSSIVPHILFNYEFGEEHGGDKENKENFPVALCMDYKNKNKVYFGRSIRETIDKAIIAMKEKVNDKT